MESSIRGEGRCLYMTHVRVVSTVGKLKWVHDDRKLRSSQFKGGETV